MGEEYNIDVQASWDGRLIFEVWGEWEGGCVDVRMCVIYAMLFYSSFLGEFKIGNLNSHILNPKGTQVFREVDWLYSFDVDPESTSETINIWYRENLKPISLVALHIIECILYE
jgi:hypothetical protein